MSEGKCSPGPWKAIENSWQYTTIYDAHDREICRLDLERFEDLNEETQDKYEAIQRADAAAIVLACDHDAALRCAKAEVLRELTQSLTYTRFNSYEQGMCERGCGLTKEGKIGASIGLAWALGEIDARATLQKGRT